MKTLIIFKKRLRICFEKSLDLWRNSQVVLLVDMKNFQKIVEVARKMMLENLVPLNVYI
jgi:hypothetical protein